MESSATSSTPSRSPPSPPPPSLAYRTNFRIYLGTRHADKDFEEADFLAPNGNTVETTLEGAAALPVARMLRVNHADNRYVALAMPLDVPLDPIPEAYWPLTVDGGGDAIPVEIAGVQYKTRISRFGFSTNATPPSRSYIWRF